MSSRTQFPLMVIKENRLERKFAISQQIFLSFPTNSAAGINRGLNVSVKQRVNKHSTWKPLISGCEKGVSEKPGTLNME